VVCLYLPGIGDKKTLDRIRGKMKFRAILNGILSHYKKGEEYD
jgi:hypothetical protein